MNSNLLKEYKLSKEEYRACYWFCLQYHGWKRKLEELSVIASPSSDGMPRASFIGDPTSAKAIKASELLSKVNIVESCARVAGDEWLAEALLKSATEYGQSYRVLQQAGLVPCGERQFRERRRMFYFLINQKI